jgi:hypothetical protein
MNAIKTARKWIQEDPHSDDAKTLAKLVLSLESDTAFELRDLYSMSFDKFELAMDILREWRLDRYYAGKLKLLGVSHQVQEMAAH